MKKLIISLFAISSITAMASSTTIKRLKVPSAIHTAVEENYEFGRNQADFGGISSVRYFKVLKNSQYRNLKAVVGYLVSNEKGNIGYVCPEMSISECVSRFKSGEYSDSEYMHLFNDGYENDDEMELADFAQNILDIDNFVKSKAPKGIKYTACENVWSVDVCTSIIIDETKGRAVTVDFDYGA